MSAQLPESDVTNALSSLERLSDDELKRIINDEDYFDDFVRNLPQVLLSVSIGLDEFTKLIIYFFSFTIDRFRNGRMTRKFF